MSSKTLRLVLGDQLNLQHSWFSSTDSNITYVLMEMRQETDYVRHHIQKVIGFFTAMRTFAKTLSHKGHNVEYLTLNNPENTQSLTHNLKRFIAEHAIQRFEYQQPDEYRLDEQLRSFCSELTIETAAVRTEHFLTKRGDLAAFFAGKKTYLMESFYRNMRKKHGILMQGNEPVGGKWNFDQANRNKMPGDHTPPAPFVFNHDVTEIHDLIRSQGVKTIGHVKPESFDWPVDRKESLALLDWFLENCLVHFGTFQDALTPDFWSLYHSRISFSLNTKMISPLEVCQKAEAYWHENQDHITIAQVEGFIRQILGWREFMRGVYWAHMPGFAEMNFFGHTNKLPDWFWTGETRMHCLHHSINQSLEKAYAHHIQRLMVTGNFALLAGIDPDEVDRWYLGIYIDAIEWVEITNTRGMSQFADGGLIATKPYVSSANYLHKMGHYCDSCFYDRKLKTGEKACPFNSLYWHFFDRNREKLEKNPRIGMAYRTWNKMNPEKRADILQQAEQHLQNLNEL
jgi:deoxyribodipyrimidine photolyase-related protein